MKWLSIVGLSLALAVVAACQKKEEAAPPPPPPPAMSQGLPGSAPADIPKIEGGGVTVVPEHVKGKWKAVVLVVEDKAQKQTKDYTMVLGQRLKIPGSAIDVEVLD